MAKFVRMDSAGYVQEVSNTSVFNCDYEVPDTAAVGKWIDRFNVSGTGANTVHTLRYYPMEMIKDIRNRLLVQSDFLVAADSPYIDDSDKQTRIKTWRQKMRDAFSSDASKSWKSWNGYQSGDIFHSGIDWPRLALTGTANTIDGTDPDYTIRNWQPQVDESGFITPGGEYVGVLQHGTMTDDNFF